MLGWGGTHLSGVGARVRIRLRGWTGDTFVHPVGLQDNFDRFTVKQSLSFNYSVKGYWIPDVSTGERQSVTLTGRARAMLRRHPSTKASFSMVTVKEHNDNNTIRGMMIAATPPGGACRGKKRSWSLPCRVFLSWRLDWDVWGERCADDLTAGLYIQADEQLVTSSTNGMIMKASNVGKSSTSRFQGVVKDQGCTPHLTFMETISRQTIRGHISLLT